MRKSIIRFTLLLILLSVTIIPCQAQKPNQLQFGVEAGLNISNLYTGDASISDMIPGFNIGVIAKIPVTENLSIQPELYLTTKGASITYNTTFADGTAKFDVTYIELPVLCIMKVSHYIYIQFGPYVSWLVDAKVTNMANIHLFNFQKNINPDNYNRIDAGLIGGIGVEVHSINMGVRYSYGFSKVGKEQTFLGASYTIPNATNGVVNFYLSVPLF